MSGSMINSRIQRGFGIVGLHLGKPYQHYRPTRAFDPLDSSNLLETVTVAIDNNVNLTFNSTTKYGKPIRYGAFDSTGYAVGDYLVSGDETHFIASTESDVPAMLVQCNRVLHFCRPPLAFSAGEDQTYSGDQSADELLLARSWPVSMEAGTKGNDGPTNLPGDSRLPWQLLLCPTLPGCTLRNDDVAYDDLGQKHILSGVVLTDKGYQMTAELMTA